MTSSETEDRLEAGEGMPKLRRTGWHDWQAREAAYLEAPQGEADGMVVQAKEAQRWAR